jgi:hypothetical protein
VELSEPVITGLFALSGVLIGGSLQGILNAVMERRHDGWAARKAARLFNPRLTRFIAAQSEARTHGWTWGDLATVVEANLDDWDGYADVFAGTLEYEDWFKVYLAVRGLEQLTWTVDGDAKIGDSDTEYLDGLMERVLEASALLTMVAFRGVRKHRIRTAFNRVRYRLFPGDEDEFLREAAIDPAELPEDDDGKRSSGHQ